MTHATIEVEVIEQRDATVVLRLKTGFGDPILTVHKDQVALHEVEK